MIAMGNCVLHVILCERWLSEDVVPVCRGFRSLVLVTVVGKLV